EGQSPQALPHADGIASPLVHPQDQCRRPWGLRPLREKPNHPAIVFRAPPGIAQNFHRSIQFGHAMMRVRIWVDVRVVLVSQILISGIDYIRRSSARDLECLVVIGIVWHSNGLLRRTYRKRRGDAASPASRSGFFACCLPGIRDLPLGDRGSAMPASSWSLAGRRRRILCSAFPRQKSSWVPYLVSARDAHEGSPSWLCFVESQPLVCGILSRRPNLPERWTEEALRN